MNTALSHNEHAYARPRLAAKAELRTDPITRQPLLLFPEGLLQLNATAHAILTLCDGTRTMKDLLLCLARDYDRTPESLYADVAACLDQLHQRRLIHLQS